MEPVFPILWIGPAGCGKLTAARAALGVPPGREPRLQTLEVGDYTARYWEFPTHMEIDVLDLSMMDKQILAEMLTQLLETRDVLREGGRKVMILRRIHGLSPAAAARLRAVLEELVWSPSASAVIWCTARTLTSVVATVADGFVWRRVEGGAQRLDRAAVAAPSAVPRGSDASLWLAGAGTAVPTIQSYVAETLRQMVVARAAGPPCLAVAGWIRGRVYDLLGLMIVGAELVSALTWSVVRMAAMGALSDGQARRCLEVLARARWYPSYRTPLMLEMILTAVYGALEPDSAALTG
jgi:hypothetical protein